MYVTAAVAGNVLQKLGNLLCNTVVKGKCTTESLQHTAVRRAAMFLTTMPEERKYDRGVETSCPIRVLMERVLVIRDTILCYLKFATNTITKIPTNATT
jgi:hypothetical protein